MRRLPALVLAALAVALAAPSPGADGETTAAPGVERIGRSVQGRPIEMWSFGAVEGGRPVIVMGAIHGNETASAEVPRRLQPHLAPAPLCPPVAIQLGVYRRSHRSLVERAAEERVRRLHGGARVFHRSVVAQLEHLEAHDHVGEYDQVDRPPQSGARANLAVSPVNFCVLADELGCDP